MALSKNAPNSLSALANRQVAALHGASWQNHRFRSVETPYYRPLSNNHHISKSSVIKNQMSYFLRIGYKSVHIFPIWLSLVLNPFYTRLYFTTTTRSRYSPHSGSLAIVGEKLDNIYSTATPHNESDARWPFWGGQKSKMAAVAAIFRPKNVKI